MPPGPASALGGGEGGGAGRGGGGARGRGKSGAPRRGSGRGTRRQQSASKPGSVRKTCDFCNYRKKRCDHGRPCGYCVRKNNGNCVYSLRKQQSRRSGPQLPPGHPGPDHLNSDEEDPGESAGVLVPVPTPPDPPEDEGDNPGAPRPKLPRMEKVASMATGLVGKRENVYLSNFFGCMGKMPLVGERTIRQVMSNLLFSGNRSRAQTLARGRGCGGAGGGGKRAMVRGEDTDHGGHASIFSASRGPEVCMFWCAVAIGGLLQGEPTEWMREYTDLAEEAISGVVLDHEMWSTSRAWTLMAYLKGLSQDSEGYRDSQRRAQLWFNRATERETRELSESEIEERKELELLIHHLDGLGLFYGDGSVSSFHVNEYLKHGSQSGDVRQQSARHPQMPFVASVRMIAKFIMTSYRRFGQAFFTDVMGHRTNKTARCDGGVESGWRAPGVRGMDTATRATAAAAVEAFYPGPTPSTSSSIVYLGLTNNEHEDADGNFAASPDVAGAVAGAGAGAVAGAGAGADADADACLSSSGGAALDDGVGGVGGVGVLRMPDQEFILSGNGAFEPPDHGSRNMQRMMVAAKPEYHRLHLVVDKEDDELGIITLMMNCTSVVLLASLSNWVQSVERVRRCVKVLTDYPGLMRFPMGLHMTHLLLAMLAGADQRAALDTRPLYEELRRAYNGVQPEGYGEIPPFEDWNGMSDCCSHVYCRAIDTRFGAQKDVPSLARPKDVIQDEVEAMDEALRGAPLEELLLVGPGDDQVLGPAPVATVLPYLKERSLVSGDHKWEGGVGRDSWTSTVSQEEPKPWLYPRDGVYPLDGRSNIGDDKLGDVLRWSGMENCPSMPPPQPGIEEATDPPHQQTATRTGAPLSRFPSLPLGQLSFASTPAAPGVDGSSSSGRRNKTDFGREGADDERRSMSTEMEAHYKHIEGPGDGADGGVGVQNDWQEEEVPELASAYSNDLYMVGSEGFIELTDELRRNMSN